MVITVILGFFLFECWYILIKIQFMSCPYMYPISTPDPIRLQVLFAPYEDPIRPVSDPCSIPIRCPFDPRIRPISGKPGTSRFD